MKYELTFLLGDEEEAKKIKEIFKTFKAELLKEDAWGERTLAYPIKKSRAAKYFNWVFEIDDSKINDLRKKLNYEDKIVRFLLLKMEEK